MSLSVCIICFNEEANISRTLASVIDIADEVVLLDSGSTDRTLQVASGFGSKVKVFVEPWKGFAAQKNSALAKATYDWILSLDADESLSAELRSEIAEIVRPEACVSGKFCETMQRAGTDPRSAWEHAQGKFAAYSFPRRNIIFGRWMRHGGFYPDSKVRLIRRGAGCFEDRPVHEDLKVQGRIGRLRGDFIHHAYPTISGYIEHINRYSDLGARMVVSAKGPRAFSVADIVVRPAATFLYNYVLRLGFLDGREGLLLHLYHAAYVSLKYAKAWELSKTQETK